MDVQVVGSQGNHRREFKLRWCLIWVVVTIMVPFGVPIIIRHLIFRVPKSDHDFYNHPYTPP